MATSEAALRLGLSKDSPYAVKIRLNPQLLAALRDAQRRGDQPTIQLGQPPEPSVLTVGGVAHRFTANADELCCVVRLPAVGGASARAEVVGDVQRRLKLARTVNDGLGVAPAQPEPVKKVVVQLPPQVRAAPASGGPGPRANLDKPQLRLVLISLLAARRMGRKAISNALDAVAQAVPGFSLPSDKQQVESAIKGVAAFKPPGVYALNVGLEKELERVPDSLKPLIAAAGAVAALAAAKPVPTPAAVPGAAPPAPAAGTKRKKESDAAPAPKRQAQPSPSLPSAATGSAGASGAQRAGSRPPGSASSRGSADADESWVLEHALRKPRVELPPVTSAEEYDALEEEFRPKYEAYFRLHQLLAANRGDFEALDAAVAAAPNRAERELRQADVDKLWRRRGERMQRWAAAFEVLEKELTAIKTSQAVYAAARAEALAARHKPGAQHEEVI